MQKDSREVLSIFGITVIEARAIKNKLDVNSIAEQVSLYRQYDFNHQRQQLVDLYDECLMNTKQAEKYVDILERIFNSYNSTKLI